MGYMETEFIKRGYYFTPELLKEWEIFHLPSKDYSPSAAASFLAYMVLEPEAREALRKLACQKDIKKAKVEARKIIRQNIVSAYIAGFVKTEEDKKILMENFLIKAKHEGDAISDEERAASESGIKGRKRNRVPPASEVG